MFIHSSSLTVFFLVRVEVTSYVVFVNKSTKKMFLAIFRQHTSFLCGNIRYIMNFIFTHRSSFLPQPSTKTFLVMINQSFFKILFYFQIYIQIRKLYGKSHWLTSTLGPLPSSLPLMNCSEH